MGYPCKCYRCGKLFYVGDLSQYVFKIQNHPFCSWSCYRKQQQVNEFVRIERLKRNGQKSTLYKKRVDKR